MGTQTNEEKLSLIEFLYKDNEFISSLYSQLFGGDLQGISQIAATAEECNVDAGVNIGIANSKALTKDIVTEQLIKNIISKDEKIIELFSELDIKEYTKSLNNCKSGKIIKLSGNLHFRNLNIIKNILPLVNKLGFIPNIFTDNDSDEIKESLVNTVSSALPDGLEFEIITDMHEKVICSINEENLVSNINYISKNYKSKFIGKWTIVGILDNTISSIDYTHQKDNDLREFIDQIESCAFEMIYPKNSSQFVIKPIVIYRTLNY
jgi:hypothetical protein